MAGSFTVFEKFGDVCAALNEGDRKELIYAINMYGMFGETVELSYPLNALFISLREDIDNSKSARERGTKGGRPRSSQKVSGISKPEVSDNGKPEVPEDAEPEVSETQKPEVSEVAKPEVSKVPKPVVSGDREKTESQTNTDQTNTSQTSTDQASTGQTRKRGGRFAPPSVDEVRAYCSQKDYTFDPEAFCAFYASKGWKVGRQPMRSWRDACTTWQKRETARSPARRGGVLDEYARL